MLSSDGTWQMLGVTEETIRLSAEQLRSRGDLNDRVHRFFDEAGTLILHSWYSYPLASIAFFHAILGVEKALRVRFGADSKTSFADLWSRAIRDGIVHDGVFRRIVPIRKELTKKIPEKNLPYSQLLARLIPLLRNEYFHGDHILADDFLPLSLRMREVADALAEKRSEPLE